MNELFASGGQSIGASASTTVLSKNVQGWFLLGLTGLISLQSKALSRVFSRFRSILLSNIMISIYINPENTHTYIFFFRFFCYRLLQDTEYSSLYYTVGPC